MKSAASTGSELDGFGAASGRALNTAGSSAPPGSDSTAATPPCPRPTGIACEVEPCWCRSETATWKPRWQQFRSWLHDWIGRDNEPMSIESWWELNAQDRHSCEVWHDNDCVCSICEDAHDPADALIEEGR